MEIENIFQLKLFTTALLAGGILSLIYIIFRVVHLFKKSKELVYFIEDFLYFVFCALSFFIYIFMFNRGQVRLYLLISFVVGWLIFYLTLGNLIVFLFLKLKNKISHKMAKEE